jgi:hypothetical protein
VFTDVLRIGYDTQFEAFIGLSHPLAGLCEKAHTATRGAV